MTEPMSTNSNRSASHAVSSSSRLMVPEPSESICLKRRYLRGEAR